MDITWVVLSPESAATLSLSPSRVCSRVTLATLFGPSEAWFPPSQGAGSRRHYNGLDTSGLSYSQVSIGFATWNGEQGREETDGKSREERRREGGGGPGVGRMERKPRGP